LTNYIDADMIMLPCDMSLMSYIDGIDAKIHEKQIILSKILRSMTAQV